MVFHEVPLLLEYVRTNCVEVGSLTQVMLCPVPTCQFSVPLGAVTTISTFLTIVKVPLLESNVVGTLLSTTFILAWLVGESTTGDQLNDVEVVVFIEVHVEPLFNE